MQAKARLEESLEEFKANIEETGCTLVCDCWTDISGRALLNFIVCSPEGALFVSSQDCGADTKDGQYIADSLAEVIEARGAETVKLVVMDNASACVTAGTLLEEK